MVLNIIFSYNRAMQLDYLLQSILRNYKFEYKIIIIYHTSGKHKEGYELLKKKYSTYNFISFQERKKVIFDTANFHAIHNLQSLKFIIKKSILFDKNADNFKSLLERILKKSDCEFVMFNTDDGYYLEPVCIDDSIFKMISNNPETVSHRLYVGENHVDIPPYVKKWGSDCMLWDYYTEKRIHHWSFPFAVDGTIYHTKALHKILKNVAYHNPVTLEGNGVEYVLAKKKFSIGTSPLKMKLIGTKLNRVSTDTLNPTIHVDPLMLNEKFLNGYELELILPEPINNANIVPLNVFCVRGNERISLYELDENGRKVQNNLGAEGAKIQMQ